jgi:hypothetical protein
LGTSVGRTDGTEKGRCYIWGGTLKGVGSRGNMGKGDSNRVYLEEGIVKKGMPVFYLSEKKKMKIHFSDIFFSSPVILLIFHKFKIKFPNITESRE